MSHSIYVVKFQDGLSLYGIRDTTDCVTYRFLFHTRKEAKNWIFSKPCIVPEEPKRAVETEEAVIFEPDEMWEIETRASRSAMWLTGARNYEDLENEQPMHLKYATSI
ncbi:hypothetical protein [Xenorhabdus ishibashii]|uniref:Uncharacterized protein n=1 Tax=Xenorhabdus ishibashii TaxID=1034471 RepID=A0A2D0K7T6_9GAMM|nr:hypothetical protein [Xenorhabdus ishibashii]PHM59504.1 hypothetical protein Xish_03622 [Xenorhabdus ishibashii]